MKSSKPAFSMWLFVMVSLAAFGLAACNKSSSHKVTSYPQVSTNTLKQQRFVWNFQTLVEPYEKGGYANPIWNEPAKKALTEFARTRSQVTASNEPWGQIISTNCDLAVKAGCKDPMVRYLHTKHSLNQTNSREVFTAAFSSAAQEMQQSSYPNVRKFYASLRATEQIKYATGTNNPPEMHQYRRQAMSDLAIALQDKSMPIDEVDDACQAMRDALSSNKKQMAEFFFAVEKPLFESWSNAACSWLLKGQFYVDHAWAARGGGYANTVTDEGWKLFAERLTVAEESLERAWQLNPKDPRIAREMLTVELGQGKGRDRMELWFERAMAFDPNYYEACKAKKYYLEPKWHGSEEDMLVFGWECVESKKWGGRVPLVLVDVHDAICRYLDKSEQEDYWKRPEVWPDIEAAFDRFFQLNPEATDWYHNYACYAYRCERWDKLNELIPRLGPINYTYFGGKDEYDKMVSLAKEHAQDVMPAPDVLLVESKRLIARIKSKVNQEKDAEKDFEEELKQCDALLAKYKDRKSDDAALILFTKAMLYWRTFDNTSKGKDLIIQLRQDFPETKPARNADRILALIARQEEAAKTQSGLTEGTSFPEFDEKDLNGRSINLANYKDKVVLIDFWATWCGPCVLELPNVLKTYEKYHENGFEVIGISLDDDREKLESFIKQRGMTWPQFFDGLGWGNKLAQKYGVNSIPATYLLDGEGKIIGKGLRGDDLEAAVAKALAKK